MVLAPISPKELTIDGVRWWWTEAFRACSGTTLFHGLNLLVTDRESRASADQRAGRRELAPGVCYRCLGATHIRHGPLSPPEILVSRPFLLALDLAVWGVSDPGVLSWLDPPPLPSFSAAKYLLP